MGASYHKANFIIMKGKKQQKITFGCPRFPPLPIIFAFLPDACHHKMFGFLSVWRFLLFFFLYPIILLFKGEVQFSAIGPGPSFQFTSSYLSALTFMSSHGIFFCAPLFLFVSKFPLLKGYNSCCLSDHSRGFILIVLSPNAVTFYDTGIQSLDTWILEGETQFSL